MGPRKQAKDSRKICERGFPGNFYLARHSCDESQLISFIDVSLYRVEVVSLFVSVCSSVPDKWYDFLPMTNVNRKPVLREFFVGTYPKGSLQLEYSSNDTPTDGFLGFLFMHVQIYIVH